jgi:hypothetical protein
MVEKQDKASLVRAAAAAGEQESLPYRIELWHAIDDHVIERVLARACSAPLARAIFKAARTEYPDRRITLSRGKRVVAESGE